MDLSALIFVALAVAWAAYLIPKALRHHEDSDSSRTVEGFSARIRVLARREPVDGKTARLVVEGEKPKLAAEAQKPAASTASAAPAAAARRPVPVAVRRAAAARAARRRLRVVVALLVVTIAVGVLAATGVVGYVALVAPGVLLVAWLVACRLMVRQERSAAPVRRTAPAPAAAPAEAAPVAAADDDPVTEEIRLDLATEGPAPVVAEPAATDEAPEPDPAPVAEVAEGWEPRPTTLPTYVTKEPAARRSVRTIDLDSTGVWTSGPHAGDSALAREADAERASRATRGEQAEAERKRRAAGS